MRFQDRGLVLPLVGDAERDGQPLLRDRQGYTARSLEGSVVEQDGDLTW